MGSSILRLANEGDATGVCAIYAPAILYSPASFETEIPTETEMRRRIRDILKHLPWLVCEEADEVRGYAYASPHRARAAYRWSVDVTVYVHPEHHREGIGRALYTSLLALLPLQNYFNAYAGITLPNAASVGLHESVGFEPVGVYRSVGYKMGQWHDVGWWQRSLQPHTLGESAPPEPIPLLEVQDTPAWEASLASGLPFLRDKK